MSFGHWPHEEAERRRKELDKAARKKKTEAEEKAAKLKKAAAKKRKAAKKAAEKARKNAKAEAQRQADEAARLAEEANRLAEEAEEQARAAAAETERIAQEGQQWAENEARRIEAEITAAEAANSRLLAAIKAANERIVRLQPGLVQIPSQDFDQWLKAGAQALSQLGKPLALNLSLAMRNDGEEKRAAILAEYEKVVFIGEYGEADVAFLGFGNPFIDTPEKQSGTTLGLIFFKVIQVAKLSLL